jgi:hypothetical protein
MAVSTALRVSLHCSTRHSVTTQYTVQQVVAAVLKRQLVQCVGEVITVCFDTLIRAVAPASDVCDCNTAADIMQLVLPILSIC